MKSYRKSRDQLRKNKRISTSNVAEPPQALDEKCGGYHVSTIPIIEYSNSALPHVDALKDHYESKA